jgi:hypothetical protein
MTKSNNAVRTSVKAGGLGTQNHAASVRTSVLGGGLSSSNHAATVRG